MKSITIHGLDQQLDQMIRKKAKAESLSLNQTLKKLLRKALGLQNRSKISHAEEFKDLFGVCSKDDTRELKKKLKETGKIDKEDWA